VRRKIEWSTIETSYYKHDPLTFGRHSALNLCRMKLPNWSA